MDEAHDSPERGGAAPEDRAAGRAVLVAVEWLGETLSGCVELPPSLRKQATALASGRSRVPADGERTDFVRRVRDAMAPPPERAEDLALTLAPWLGAALTAWLRAQLRAEPVTALGLALRDPISRCVEARAALRALQAPVADAFVAWNTAGLEVEARAVYAAASAVALDEATDRWCALGCEADLQRYVATWQRSSAGWAEAALGARVDVPVGDLGLLRAMQTHLRELHARRAPSRSLPRALAARLGVTEPEAARLLAVHAAVAARLDPTAMLRRRMEVVRPIARAAAELERELGRAPRVPEIASRAAVHPCLVELALEALEAT